MRAPGGIAYEPNRETSIDIRGDVQTPATVAGLLLGSGALAGGGSSTSAFGTTSRLLRVGANATWPAWSTATSGRSASTDTITERRRFLV